MTRIDPDPNATGEVSIHETPRHIYRALERAFGSDGEVASRWVSVTAAGGAELTFYEPRMTSDAIAGLRRDPHAILRELCLWRDTLEDARTINAACEAVSDSIAPAAVTLVELALLTERDEQVEELADVLRGTLDALTAIGVALDGITGRAESLLPELDQEIDALRVDAA